jgi:predicted O-methyltransferase YrrM
MTARESIEAQRGLWRRFSPGSWFSRPRQTAMALPVTQAPQQLPELSTVGVTFPPYRRSFSFAGEFIDADHRAIAELPAPEGLIVTDVQGFLRPADALTLYELAYFAAGDILELGSAWGLSTTILCRAAANAGRGSKVWSVELDPEFQKATAHAVSSHGLQQHYRALPGDANQVMRDLIAHRRTFSVMFVDHDHGYGSVHTACEALPRLLVQGGMALFHDFNDDRNATEAGQYGIYRAVRELLADPEMSFLGTIGCCALVHRAG